MMMAIRPVGMDVTPHAKLSRDIPVSILQCLLIAPLLVVTGFGILSQSNAMTGE